MPFITSGQSGITLFGIEVLEGISRDSEQAVNSTAVLWAGRAVSISAGVIVSATDASTFVYGLTDTNKNSFMDDTKSQTGEFGSGKANVIKKGRVLLRDISVIDSTGAEQTIKGFDSAQTFVAGDKVAVLKTANDTLSFGGPYAGLVTKQTGNANAGALVIGTVAVANSSTSPELIIDLDCPAGGN